MVVVATGAVVVVVATGAVVVVVARGAVVVVATGAVVVVVVVDVVVVDGVCFVSVTLPTATPMPAPASNNTKAIPHTPAGLMRTPSP